jgi:hypothetical protein
MFWFGDQFTNHCLNDTDISIQEAANGSTR